MAEDKKKLYVTAGNQSMWVDEDKFQKNAQNLYAKYPDAQVFSFDDYDPKQNADVEEGTQFFVTDKTSGDGAFVDYDKFVANKDNLYAKYPDAQVRTVHDYGNDYWKGVAEQQKAEIDRFNQENGKFISDYSNKESEWSQYTMSDSGFMTAPQKEALAYLGENLGKYNDLVDERRRLTSEYANNPYVKGMYKAKAEAAGNLESEYRTKANELNPISGSGPAYGVAGYNAWTNNMAYKGEDPQGDIKESKYFNEASQLEQKIQKTYLVDTDKGKGNNGFADYLSNFGAGHADTFSDSDFWSRGLTTIARNLDIRGIIKSLEDKGLNINTMSEKELDDNLTDGQKALLSSFVRLADAQSERANDMAPGYTAGQTSAESLGYMAEFIATGGIARAAGSAIKGGEEATASGLRNFLARELSREGSSKAIYSSVLRGGIERTAKSGGLKAASDAAKLGIKAEAKVAQKAYDYVIRPIEGGIFHTVLQPSTYSTISDNLTQTDDNGKLVSAGKAMWGGVVDQLIENWSEMMGGAVEDVIDLPLKAAGYAGEKILGKTTLGQWGKWLVDSNAAKVLKDAGWHGLIGEMGEEWVGNAARVALGLMDADEFKQFASVHDQLEMAASFAPVALFGLGSTSYAAARQAKNYRKTADAMRGVMGRLGYSEEDISRVFDNHHTQKEIADELSPVLQKIVSGAADGKVKMEDYETTLRFAQAAAMDEVLRTAQSIEQEHNRNAVKSEIEQSLGGSENSDKGRFWTLGSYRSEGGKPFELDTVTEVSDESGKQYFNMGESNGVIALKNQADGSLKFVDTAEYNAGLESGEWQAQSSLLNDYLDARVNARIETERKQEKSALIAQRNAEVQNRCQPGMQVTFGTEDNPLVGKVVENQADGVVVSFDKPVELNGETGLVHKVSYAQVANATGVNVDTRTEDEKEADQATRDEMGRERVKVFNNAMKGKQFATGGQLYSFSHIFEEPYVNEDGTEVVDVWVKSESGAEDVEITVPVADLKEQTLTPEESVEMEKRQDDATEEVAKEDEGTPKDFRGGLLPMKLDADGQKVVDADALWNNDPEAYLRWNDSQNGGNTEDSREMLAAVIAKRQQDRAELEQRKKGETVPSARQSLNAQIRAIDGQISLYGGFLAEYEEEASKAEVARQEAQNAEAERNVPIAEQADEKSEQNEGDISASERSEMETRIVDWLSEENLERAKGKTRDEIFAEFGNELEPIAYIPSRYVSLIGKDVKDSRIYCGKGYFIDHALRNHQDAGKQILVQDVDASKYLNIQAVLDNPDSVKETYVDGKRTVVFIKKIGRFFAELTQFEEDGKIVLHKSLFNQKKEPYAKLVDIRQKDTSSEGGDSSISRADNTAPAISLESRGDVKLQDEKDIARPEPTVVSNASTGTTEVIDSPTEVVKGETVDRGGDSSQAISSASEDRQTSDESKGSAEKVAPEETATRGVDVESAQGAESEKAEEQQTETKAKTTSDENKRRQQWQKRVEKQGEIKGKMPKITKPSLYKFVDSWESPGAPPRGVFHNEGFEVASDGHILIAVRSQYDAALEGKVTDKSGEVIADEYPKLSAIQDTEPLALDLNNLASFIQGAKSINKETGNARQPSVSFLDNEGNVVTANLKSLEAFVNAARYYKCTVSIARVASPVLYAENEDGSVKILLALSPKIVGGFLYDGRQQETSQEFERRKNETATVEGVSDKNEQAVPIQSDSEIKPIGKGTFGEIYDAFRGKAKEAIAFLRKKRSGEALGALHHNDIGDIDLVWGEEGTGKSDGFGLAKLVKYHPEVLANLQEILDSMKVVSRSDNRVQLESDKHQASVRLTWNDEKKNWLLTAFEKKNSVSDNTTDTDETLSGKRNDTATPQNTVSSADKTTQSSETKQENKEKSSAEAPKTMIGDSKRPLSDNEATLRDAIIDLERKSGLDVIDDVESGQRLIDSANGKDVKLEAEAPNAIREQRVYHGSGAEFDHFDHSHIGEGEGNQAYGWGTYVTEVEGIGRTYAEQGRRKDVSAFVYNGREIDFSNLQAELSDIAGIDNDNILRHFLWEWNYNGSKRAKEYLAYEIKEAKGWRNHSSNPTAYDNKIAELEALARVKGLRKKTNKTNLYTVEIPDDNGKNYLDHNNAVDSKEVGRVLDALYDRLVADEESGYDDKTASAELRKELDSIAKNEMNGRDLYGTLSSYLGSDEEASKFLSSLGYTGIKYPADNQRGGREDGAKNYVIFNEADAKITDHVRFFRTSSGEAYGFTVGGKIYIDPRIATSETPVHEYAHLWASALKRGNKTEWQNVVELMKGTSVWEEVKKLYPDLKTDDEIADEVLAQYSGRRGAERLREAARKIAEGNGGVLGKAEAISALQRVKEAVERFWKGVCDFLHIHYTSAEEVADRVMKDLLSGVNPRMFGKADGSLRMSEDSETKEIIANAKADGTYMKAPNGKPSKLSERQWAQVRTKSFKKWFGDWEKAARIEKLRKSEPVEITGEEYKDKYELNRDSAKAWMKDNLRGEYKIADTNETVTIGRKGVNKVTSHSMGSEAHLKSIVAIPEMLNRAIFVTEEKADKANAQYPTYRYYVVGLNIGGVDYTVKLTIGVDENGNKFYDQALTEIEKGKLLDLVNGQAAVDGFISTGAEPNPSVTESKDTKLSSILQTSSSKVVDENGEPRVVYHYTDNQFTEFGKDKIIGKNTFGNASDAGYAMTTTIGHWFTTNNNQPFYMGKPMELYLNVRDPFDGYSLERLAGYLGNYISAEDVDAYEEDYNNVEPLILGGARFKEEKANEGNDGVVINDEEFGGLSYIVFDANQIKSATDNVGTFDSENNDIRFSRTVFGGNSGYVGYSMSRRAAEARENGKYPKTDFKKEYKMKDATFKALVNAEVLNDSEWHHTSMYGNKTTFYKWDEPEYMSIYEENKAEVDAMVANQAKESKAKIANLQAELDAMPKERPYKYELESAEYRNEYRRIQNESYAKSDAINDSYPLYPTESQEKERISRLEAEWADVRTRIDELNANASEADKAIIEHNRVNDEYERKLGKLKNAIWDAESNNKREFRTKLYNYFETKCAEMRVAERREEEQRKELERVNEEFNEQLGTLTEDNADNVVLSLGSPSAVLRAAGVENKPMKLYGNKVVKKMRKHGFSMDEIRDLPSAVANPIAVFNNYGKDGNRSILTELHTANGNFLVTLSTGVDQDVDFNVIRSVFGKRGESVVDWINKGLATYINKEKALSFLSYQSAPIAATAASEELSSAANVVETFENPNISEESDEDSIRFSIVPGTGRVGTDTALNSVSENGLTAEMSEEDADDLLLDLYQSISEKTRQKVTQKAMKNGFSFPKAMADYIAEMDTDNLSNEDKACLTKARNAIKNALGIVTDGTNTGLSLTDTQWIMYQTAHAGENGIFDLARRVETADRLGHTKADEEEKRDIDNGISVQRADDAVSDSAADMYNKSVSYWLNRLKEGYVDQFESVNALVEAIENELF